MNRHNRFFHRGIAGPFAEPVYRAFDLSCTIANTRERISRSHTEVVVAVRAYHDIVDAFNAFPKETRSGAYPTPEHGFTGGEEISRLFP